MSDGEQPGDTSGGEGPVKGVGPGEAGDTGGDDGWNGAAGGEGGTGVDTDVVAVPTEGKEDDFEDEGKGEADGEPGRGGRDDEESESEDEDADLEELPIFANDENRELHHRVKSKEQELETVEDGLKDNSERLKVMREHLRNVQQELQHTQQLVDAKTREVDTEKHLYQISSREVGRIEQEMRRVEDEREKVQDQLNVVQNAIFKGNERMDRFQMQMNWNKEELEQWALAAKQKEEDTMALEKYTRADEGPRRVVARGPRRATPCDPRSAAPQPRSRTSTSRSSGLHRLPTTAGFPLSRRSPRRRPSRSSWTRPPRSFARSTRSDRRCVARPRRPAAHACPLALLPRAPARQPVAGGHRNHAAPRRGDPAGGGAVRPRRGGDASEEGHDEGARSSPRAGTAGYASARAWGLVQPPALTPPPPAADNTAVDGKIAVREREVSALRQRQNRAAEALREFEDEVEVLKSELNKAATTMMQQRSSIRGAVRWRSPAPFRSARLPPLLV